MDSVKDTYKILFRYFQIRLQTRMICSDTPRYGFKPILMYCRSVLMCFRSNFSRILIRYKLSHTQPHKRHHRIYHKFRINLSKLKGQEWDSIHDQQNPCLGLYHYINVVRAIVQNSIYYTSKYFYF
jgi:hypothetical protein